MTQVLCAEGFEWLHSTLNRAVLRPSVKLQEAGGHNSFNRPAGLWNDLGHVRSEPVFVCLGLASLGSHFHSSLKNLSAVASSARHFHLILSPRFTS